MTKIQRPAFISLHDFAPEVGIDVTNVRVALKRGGYPIERMRSPRSGQMLDVVSAETAERFLADRRLTSYAPVKVRA
jgi:hypothetical protein